MEIYEVVICNDETMLHGNTVYSTVGVICNDVDMMGCNIK